MFLFYLVYAIMPSMFTVVSWLAVPLVQQVTGHRATTVNIGLTVCLCAHLFICALWSPAGKGLTSWLSFLVSKCDFVTFPFVSLVRCTTYFVSIPDLCTLTYLNVIIFFIFCASSFKCNNYGTVYIVGFQ